MDLELVQRLTSLEQKVNLLVANMVRDAGLSGPTSTKVGAIRTRAIGLGSQCHNPGYTACMI